MLKDISMEKTFPVSYNSLNNSGIINCIIAECINVVGLGIKKNVIVGISEDKFFIDGVDCILNTKLMEELC